VTDRNRFRRFEGPRWEKEGQDKKQSAMGREEEVTKGKLRRGRRITIRSTRPYRKTFENMNASWQKTNLQVKAKPIKGEEGFNH